MKELRYLSVGILGAFVIIALAAFYWSVIESDSILQREDNPRLVEAEIVTQRGNIYDRQGMLLATTTVNYNGQGLRRLYPHPEASTAVGYYSLRFGVSGIEATYDSLLRGQEGETPLETWIRQMLHRPAVGGDVRLTLDLGVQKAAARSLGERAGAVILVTIPDGAIRAMVSAPTFSADMLDENWEILVESPDAPLLNRVTQGVYQPGGFLQTSLLAIAFSQRLPMDTLLENSGAPITINDLVLICGQAPLTNDLTLLQAYIYACPGGFAQLSSLTPSTLERAFSQYGFLTSPSVLGLDTETGESPPVLNGQQDEIAAIAEMLGQGSLTITPLQALGIIAAIANDGNMPHYILVEATRFADETAWTSVENVGLARATLTRQTAEQLRLAMQSAAGEGIARAAQAETQYPILGHAAIAYSGPDATPLQWFIGMIRFADGTAIATVVVVENATESADAARVGGQALDAAARAFAPDNTLSTAELNTP